MLLIRKKEEQSQPVKYRHHWHSASHYCKATLLDAKNTKIEKTKSNKWSKPPEPTQNEANSKF